MKLVIATVGTRMPAWVNAGCDDYIRRMPRDWPVELREVKAEPRTTGKTPAAMMAAEAARLRAVLPQRCHLVAMDERGKDMTTTALTESLTQWSREGEDIAFLIGGPDGLDPGLKGEARDIIRLSSLTLPHAMVRVVLAEALYRAASLAKGHPYHRE